MCFPLDSKPPIQPISGSAISSTDLVLTSEDGTEFLAYHAVSDKPGGAGVIVMPDVRGIFGFYKDLADRFAEQGLDAVTIDYFGRTAGTGERPDDFDFMPHVEQTKVPNIAADAAAAADVLRSGDRQRGPSVVHSRILFWRLQLVDSVGRGNWPFGRRGVLRAPNQARPGWLGASNRPDRHVRRPAAWPDGRSGPGHPPGRRSRSSTGRLTAPVWNTTSTCTRGLRTRSSTAGSRSSPKRQRTPGTASWDSYERIRHKRKNL